MEEELDEELETEWRTRDREGKASSCECQQIRGRTQSVLWPRLDLELEKDSAGEEGALQPM